MVGAMNKSMAAMSGAWLRRKVRHPWLGGPRRLTMYLATLDCATSNPSLSSSPWIRGAPQSGFSMLICRISARRSVSICGRPPVERDFQRQWQRKPARCHRTSVLALQLRFLRSSEFIGHHDSEIVDDGYFDRGDAGAFGVI